MNTVSQKKDSIVLGMPPAYSSLTDPDGRVYEKMWGKLDANATSIKNTKLYPVSIEVGKPELISLADRNILNKNKNKSLATYRFGPLDNGEYSKVINALLGMAAVAEADALGKENVIFKTDKITRANLVRNAINPTFTVLASEETSITEAATNTIGESKLASVLDQGSNLVREINFTTGSADLTQAIKALTTSIGSFLGSTGKEASEGINGAIDNLMTKGQEYLGESVLKIALAGSKVILPKIWESSSFSKSYNLAFRLFSPYGAPEALLTNIVLPYLYILSFSLPRQDSINTYNYPFIVRVSSPGAFSVPMGLVTAISVKKGGSYDIWSANGAFRSLDVTLTINDLTEILPVPNTTDIAMHSVQMNSYIRSLVGADVVKGQTGPGSLDAIAKKLVTLKGGNTDIKRANYTNTFSEISRDASAIWNGGVVPLWNNEVEPEVKKVAKVAKETLKGVFSYIKSEVTNLFNPDNETYTQSPEVQADSFTQNYIDEEIAESDAEFDAASADPNTTIETVRTLIKTRNGTVVNNLKQTITEQGDILKPNLSPQKATALDGKTVILNDYIDKSINAISPDLDNELEKAKTSKSMVFKNPTKAHVDNKEHFLKSRSIPTDEDELSDEEANKLFNEDDDDDDFFNDNGDSSSGNYSKSYKTKTTISHFKTVNGKWVYTGPIVKRKPSGVSSKSTPRENVKVKEHLNPEPVYSKNKYIVNGKKTSNMDYVAHAKHVGLPAKHPTAYNNSYKAGVHELNYNPDFMDSSDANF